MFNRITIDNFKNIILPRESNLVNASEFNYLNTDVLFRSFSIKHVIEGSERYKIDNKIFNVRQGEFLLANNFSGGNVQIESDTKVKGLCIDVSPKIISEVAASIIRPDVVCFDPDLNTFFNTNLFPENKYDNSNSNLGKFIKQIGAKVNANKDHKFEFSKEFYYTIAEKVVNDQMIYYKQIKNIKSVKVQTRKEILRKIYLGKNYMDARFSSIHSMEEVASVCFMSEYHFFRLFKQVFQTSPYQYLTQKRLEYSTQLLQKRELKISEIAYLSGFADLSTFSKNFKKQFKISPVDFAKYEGI